MSAAFEADLDPETLAPRIRMNFANGWSASIVLRMGDKRRTKFAIATVAACPTGQWDKGKSQIIGGEMFPEEVASAINAIADLESVQ